MLNDMIQSISAYAEALEQKLSALEQRVALLEEANQAMKQESDEAKALVATLQAEVATLAATGVVAQASEPEVEIELIVEESGMLNMSEEPAEEPAEEPEVEAPIEEPMADVKIEAEEEIEIEVEEEAANTPAEEAVAEPQQEQPQPQSTPSHTATIQPQQTTLFGAAVEDIRQAISLGDRFLFQRELFAGNGELMQKTLDELNALGSLEEAMDYVADNFDWESDSTAVQLFENVLKRRFA